LTPLHHSTTGERRKPDLDALENPLQRGEWYCWSDGGPKWTIPGAHRFWLDQSETLF
jgi:hypothetical protein